MTETQNTETPADIIDIEIGAVDCDGNPITVGVIASIGEFDGIIVEIKTPMIELAELTIAQTRELIAALTAAVKYLDR